MATRRFSMILALGALCFAVAGDVGTPASAKPPRLPKPIRVPPTQMAPLPPAVIDNQLAIGGEDINARKVETRLTVEVRVNGRGPYHFLVDSGADTSVVGQRIARDLNLAATTPVTLNSMTAARSCRGSWFPN